MNISLPNFLNIPPKLYSVIFKLNFFQHFLIEGGRGSGKSQSVARLILYIGSKNKLKVVCGREIWTTIEESVYSLFVELIREHNLNYAVYADKIVHRRTKTVIRFRGFRELGAVNIKGLQGVDILFIDESQAITKHTLQTIIPTIIRKNKAKLFWVMNRFLEDDPVFKEFSQFGRPEDGTWGPARTDTLHIHIDYHENPHCNEETKQEALLCKKRNIDDYNHIWLGVALSSAKNSAFHNVESIVDYDLPIEQAPMKGFHYSLGSDLAKRVTHTSITIICVELKEVVYHERLATRAELSWNFIREKILMLGKRYNNAIVNPDSTGVGDPITEDLQRMGANIFIEETDQKENPKEIAGFKFSSVSKENLIEKLKLSIEVQAFRMPDIESLKKSLKKYQRIAQPNGRVKFTMPTDKDELGNLIYVEDEVLSLALALWGTRTMIYDPDYTPPEEITRTDQFWVDVKRQIVNRNMQTNALQDDDFGDIIEISDDEDVVVEEEEI